jgi:hypothetical protein
MYKKGFVLAVSTHQATSQPKSLLYSLHRTLLLCISATAPHSDAIMTLFKTITFVLAALLAVPAVTAAGGFDTCTSVSFDTFQATSVPGKDPQFGPKGLYSSSTTGECIYVDAAANGDFATTHPADYQGFIANTHILLSKIPEAAADFEYLSAAPVQERPAVTPRSAKMIARQTVGCGEVCNSTQVSGG